MGVHCGFYDGESSATQELLGACDLVGAAQDAGASGLELPPSSCSFAMSHHQSVQRIIGPYVYNEHIM